jgi:hypothetical protein
MKALALLVAGAAASFATAADADRAACAVSISASHPLAEPANAPQDQYLRIDLVNSQFRIDDAPWRSTQALCDAERLDLAAGETALVACRTDLSCGRYSFLFRVDVLTGDGQLMASRLIPFPTLSQAVEVRRERSVNLGDLRALLDAHAPSTNPRRATLRSE